MSLVIQQQLGTAADYKITERTLDGRVHWIVPVVAHLPGADGTYLEIKPPADERDGNVSFAEIMMYHHTKIFLFIHF